MITPNNPAAMPAGSYKLSGDTERRFFPKNVRYTSVGHQNHEFKAGINEVPVEFLEDQWLKDNGMKVFEGTAPVVLQPQAELGSQAYAASVASSGVYDATFVPRQHSVLDIVQHADAAEKDLAVMESNLEKQREYVEGIRKMADDKLAADAAANSAAGPQDGDTNPDTGKKYTKKELVAAQADYQRKLDEAKESGAAGNEKE